MTIFSTPGLRPEGFPDGATRQPRPSFYRNLPVLGFLAFLVLGTATAGAQASGPSGVSAPWPHPPATPIDVAQLQPTPAKIYEGGDPPSRYEFTRQLTPNQVKRAGFILPIRTWVGTVIKSYNEERSSLGTGEILYIDMGKAQGVARGDRFTVFSKGRLIKHPVILSPESEGIPDYPRPVGEAHKQFFSRHGKDVGYLVNVLGVIEVTEPGDTHSMAVIRESYNDIRIGDFVVPYQEPYDPEKRPRVKGEKDLHAYLVAFRREHYTAALNDVVYLDAGKKENVTPGDVFEVYNVPVKKDSEWYEVNETNENGIPLIPYVIGEIQVISTQEATSTAIVVNSKRPFELGQPIRYKPVDVVAQPLASITDLQEAPDYEVVEEKGMVEEEPFPAIEIEEPKEEQVVRLMEFHPTTELTDVYFEFDQNSLDALAKQALHKNAEYLMKYSHLKVRIQGHCDERGTNNYNLALGQRRAEAVKHYLVEQGVEEGRISVISFGEEKPFCFEASENCWRQNRRAHFLVSEGKNSEQL